MIYATHIRMKPSYSFNLNNYQHNKLLEIDSIYLRGSYLNSWYKKEAVYDLVKSGNKIFVNIAPYPQLVTVQSTNGEKYVRSTPNDNVTDNLLKLQTV